MRNDGPYIEVCHSEDRIADVATTYNCDTGPLSMPAHIFIGARGHDGSKVESYSNQVEEYDIWLEDQLKKQNMTVMAALEDIFGKAQEGGIILQTRCVPQPYITHAHVIKRTIMALAGD